MPPQSQHNQMRIQVAPDGNVEFSVSLSSSVDPSVVASMVAAVRAGIVSKPPPDPATPEPTSDPDGAEPPRQDRSPSPLVSVPPRKLSVRQLAAQLEAGEGRRASAQHVRYTTVADAAEYDPVKEFSSSPALWLTAKPDAYIDPYDTSHVPKHPASNRVKRSPSVQENGTKKSGIRSSQPDRIVEERDFVQPVANKPVRMLSLPSGVKYDAINDMYFEEDATSRASYAATEYQPRVRMEDLARLAASADEEEDAGGGGIGSGDESAETSDDRHSGSQEVTPADRVRARRDRAMKVVEQVRAQQDAAAGKRSSSELEEPEFHDAVGELDRADVPSSPYVQQSGLDDDDNPDDAWENVEYVLTESYRQDPKSSEVKDTRIERGRPYGRGGGWRFLWGLGNSFSRRRIEIEEDVYQGTLATGGGVYKAEKVTSMGDGGGGTTRNRGYMFGRNNTRSGGLWLEFSSTLPVERMLAEVGQVAKSLGYQVWRRAGENKLRCIRQLNQRSEMHMVILVGSIKLPDGPMTSVRLTRARSDRNRTETWRYSHFYRELIERLQRSGIEITSEV